MNELNLTPAREPDARGVLGYELDGVVAHIHTKVAREEIF